MSRDEELAALDLQVVRDCARDEAYQVSSPATRGTMAIVHSFDLLPRGVVTWLINRDYWGVDITDDDVRGAVAAVRGA